jgi:hypothetical protein
MLSKIEEIAGEKQNLELKIVSFENELIQNERKLEEQRL